MILVNGFSDHEIPPAADLPALFLSLLPQSFSPFIQKLALFLKRVVVVLVMEDTGSMPRRSPDIRLWKN